MEQIETLEKQTKNLLKNRIFIALLFAFSTVLMLLPIFFKVRFEEFKTLGLLGIFIVSFIGSATIVLPTPALLAVGYGATIYNPLLLALIAASGSTLGEITTFIFGFTSKKLVNFKTKSLTYKFFDFVIHNYGGYLIPIFAFIPNPLFDGLGIIAGLAGYSIKKYLVLTFIGRFARYLLVGLIGQQF